VTSSRDTNLTVSIARCKTCCPLKGRRQGRRAGLTAVAKELPPDLPFTSGVLEDPGVEVGQIIIPVAKEIELGFTETTELKESSCIIPKGVTGFSTLTLTLTLTLRTRVSLPQDCCQAQRNILPSESRLHETSSVRLSQTQLYYGWTSLSPYMNLDPLRRTKALSPRLKRLYVVLMLVHAQSRPRGREN
jgi:hypothetical protein